MPSSSGQCSRARRGAEMPPARRSACRSSGQRPGRPDPAERVPAMDPLAAQDPAGLGDVGAVAVVVLVPVAVLVVVAFHEVMTLTEQEQVGQHSSAAGDPGAAVVDVHHPAAGLAGNAAVPVGGAHHATEPLADVAAALAVPGGAGPE